MVQLTVNCSGINIESGTFPASLKVLFSLGVLWVTLTRPEPAQHLAKKPAVLWNTKHTAGKLQAECVESAGHLRNKSWLKALADRNPQQPSGTKDTAAWLLIHSMVAVDISFTLNRPLHPQWTESLFGVQVPGSPVSTALALEMSQQDTCVHDGSRFGGPLLAHGFYLSHTITNGYLCTMFRFPVLETALFGPLLSSGHWTKYNQVLQGRCVEGRS